MTRNNLTTDGSEFLLPDGKPYSGSYHIHVTKGAMEGEKHTRRPHRSLTPVNEVIARRVGIIQRGMRNESVPTAATPSAPRPQVRRQRPTTPMRRPSSPPASQSYGSGSGSGSGSGY